MSDEEEAPDLLGILDGFGPLRDTLRGVVAMFVADGFTDREAHALVVHTVTGLRSDGQQ